MFYINYEECKVNTLSALSMTPLSFILTMRNVKEYQQAMNNNKQMRFILTMRNVKTNLSSADTQANSFYINYEECKVVLPPPLSGSRFCFILTMRNVKL